MRPPIAAAINRSLKGSRWGIVAALLAGWSPLAFAVFLAGLFAIVGAVIGGLGATISVGGLGNGGVGQGLGIIGAAVGAAVFAARGFAFGWGGTLQHAFGGLVLGLVAGVVFAVVVTVFMAELEPWTLRLRHYRRTSDRETDQLRPLVMEMGEKLGIEHPPPVVMDDRLVPAAWTHMSCIVVTRGLLQLDEEEIAAVLGHELAHWRRGDVMTNRLAWAAALPAAAAYNFGVWLSGAGKQPVDQSPGGGIPGERPPMLYPSRPSVTLTVIAWVILWPFWVVMRCVVAPAMGADQRRQEYAADAAVVETGFGGALYSALERLQTFEPPRSGWESALAATHPPTELRLEAIDRLLDAPQGDIEVAEMWEPPGEAAIAEDTPEAVELHVVEDPPPPTVDEPPPPTSDAETVVVSPPPEPPDQPTVVMEDTDELAAAADEDRPAMAVPITGLELENRILRGDPDGALMEALRGAELLVLLHGDGTPAELTGSGLGVVAFTRQEILEEAASRVEQWARCRPTTLRGEDLLSSIPAGRDLVVNPGQGQLEMRFHRR